MELSLGSGGWTLLDEMRDAHVHNFGTNDQEVADQSLIPEIAALNPVSESEIDEEGAYPDEEEGEVYDNMEGDNGEDSDSDYIDEDKEDEDKEDEEEEEEL